MRWSWLNRQTLFRQMMAGALFIGCFAGMIGLSSLYEIARLNGNQRALVGGVVRPWRGLEELRADFSRLRLNVLRQLRAETPAERLRLQGERGTLTLRLDSALASYAEGISGAEERALVGRAHEAERRYVELSGALIEASAAGAAVDLAPASAAADEVEGALAELSALKERQLQDHIAAAGALGSQVLRIVLLLMVLGSLVAVATTALLARRTAAGIREVAERGTRLRETTIVDLSRAMEGVARGDLSREVRFDSVALGIDADNEIGDLARCMDDIVGEVRTIVSSFAAARATLADLVQQTAMQTHAAAGGDLATRADVARFEGAYRELVEGMNATLDAAVAPMQEAGRVLARLAGGDFTRGMEGEYQGDHAVLKENLNPRWRACAGCSRASATARHHRGVVLADPHRAASRWRARPRRRAARCSRSLRPASRRA